MTRPKAPPLPERRGFFAFSPALFSTMNPSQLRTVVSHAWESIARVPFILADSPGSYTACCLGLVSWVVGVSNTRLLSIVIFAMLADLIVGTLWSVINPHVDFDRTKLYGGILGKVFRLTLIPVGALTDELFMLSPLGTVSADPTRPIVAFLMWALAIAELVSALNTFVAAGIIPKQLAELIQRLEGDSRLTPSISGPVAADHRDPA